MAVSGGRVCATIVAVALGCQRRDHGGGQTFRHVDEGIALHRTGVIRGAGRQQHRRRPAPHGQVHRPTAGRNGHQHPPNSSITWRRQRTVASPASCSAASRASSARRNVRPGAGRPPASARGPNGSRCRPRILPAPGIGRIRRRGVRRLRFRWGGGLKNARSPPLRREFLRIPFRIVNGHRRCDFGAASAARFFNSASVGCAATWPSAARPPPDPSGPGSRTAPAARPAVACDPSNPEPSSGGVAGPYAPPGCPPGSSTRHMAIVGMLVKYVLKVTFHRAAGGSSAIASASSGRTT